jgi:predicted membrane protein (TIGR00267 family)
MFSKLRALVSLTHSHRIARRYFVTNGFDGVLATLGVLTGFRSSPQVHDDVVLGACLGASIALFMSGVTSAYISESAEKNRELRRLERSMIKDLQGSAFADAARLMPVFISLVNGLSPLLLSLVVLSPLFIVRVTDIPLAPVDAALIVALALIFLLGVFLGRISGHFWLWTGLRAVVIAVVTGGIIQVTQQVFALP